MAERDQGSIVLALEAPGGPNSRRQRRRQRSRPRARPSSSRSGACPSFPYLVTVHAGEDIVESIRLYFEGCESIRSRYQTLILKGHILSAQGQISNPIVKRQGSDILVEGIHTIGTLFGFYDVSLLRPVQSNSLMLSFYESNGQGSRGNDSLAEIWGGELISTITADQIFTVVNNYILPLLVCLRLY